MLIHVMTMILAVGRNMKLMMTLNICMIPLKKILEIKYTYVYLKQPTKKYLVEGNNILFLREWVIDMGYS